MKKELDNLSSLGMILIDLSKANEHLCYSLSIAKLAAYSLGKHNLNLVSDYLSFRKQRTKLGSSYCDWDNIRSIPQGSILGPLLFDNFSNGNSSLIKKLDKSNFDDGKNCSLVEVIFR